MNDISPALVAQAVALVGNDDLTEDELCLRLGELLPNRRDMGIRRLRDCIPEAFGLILASHLCPTMTLPECFWACDATGTWKAIPLQAEPVFVHALPLAAHVFHQGPRAQFERIANMSAVMNTLNNALNCGASLEGCTLEGPQMHGLPAGLNGTALESISRTA